MIIDNVYRYRAAVCNYQKHSKYLRVHEEYEKEGQRYGMPCREITKTPLEKSVSSSCRTNRLPTDHAEITDENNIDALNVFHSVPTRTERVWRDKSMTHVSTRAAVQSRHDMRWIIFVVSKGRGTRAICGMENKGEIYPGACSDRRPHPADRGRQEAHFRDDVQRCRAHVLDKAERHRAGPGPGPRTSTVRDGRATTTTTKSPRLCPRVVFGPGGHEFVYQPRGWFCELSIPSEDGNLTAHNAATPTLSLQLDWHRWHCPARPSRVQAYSERLTSAPPFAVKHGGA
ncbi:hypothetical protein ALC53_13533 [Atta colombica]|uniref:Uncharacterized protein n=1 Tax=Atta colombica TaxID=520822 RepID=A0A195AUX9_9HYME|nr:hypothetical protein ALC53_13533 [Atta colombica]